MAAILDQAWLQGKVEKSEPKILFCSREASDVIVSARAQVELIVSKRRASHKISRTKMSVSSRSSSVSEYLSETDSPASHLFI